VQYALLLSVYVSEVANGSPQNVVSSGHLWSKYAGFFFCQTIDILTPFCQTFLITHVNGGIINGPDDHAPVNYTGPKGSVLVNATVIENRSGHLMNNPDNHPPANYTGPKDAVHTSNLPFFDNASSETNRYIYKQETSSLFLPFAFQRSYRRRPRKTYLTPLHDPPPSHPPY
jgi:hypothetical protein